MPTLPYDKTEIETLIRAALPCEEGLQRTVIRAMREAVENGGKRIRPILLFETCKSFAARRGERFVSGAVAQGFDGAVEAFVLAEVAAVGGERGQQRLIGGAPVVGAGDGVQVGDGRDRLGEAVFEALQRLHQPVPSEIAARDEGFYHSAVFIKYLRDDGGVLRADGGKFGNVGGLVERVGVGHENFRWTEKAVAARALESTS